MGRFALAPGKESSVTLSAMAVSPSRRIAFDILRVVEAKGAHAGDLLHERLDARVKPQDAALATELTLGVLRWQGLLDFLVERQTKKTVAAMDAEVRIALRIGLYQLRYLNRVPARSAVNESVELVKRARKASAAGLVNAVLRRLADSATEPVETQLPAGLPRAERLAIIHSHPAWLVERWLKRFGEEQTVALLESNNRAPRTTLAVHDAAGAAQARAALEAAGMQIAAGRWLKSTLVIESGAAGPALTQSAAYRGGKISIQDEASQMIPLLLDVQPGQRVLDLCAAPGGKTMTLAFAAGPSGSVVAADLHAHRLRGSVEQLRRTGAPNTCAVALDATKPLPFSGEFDRILVDAPCSGTGTLGRNPEIRWRLRPEDLADLHRRQAELLERTLEVLAPGGVLVYATCSLEPEENEEVVGEIVAAHSEMQRVVPNESLRSDLLDSASDRNFVDAHGWFRTFPPAHHTDGFFAAILRHE